MFYYILGERVERIISETVEKDVQIITLPIMVNTLLNLGTFGALGISLYVTSRHLWCRGCEYTFTCPIAKRLWISSILFLHYILFFQTFLFFSFVLCDEMAKNVFIILQ
jgi:hypothetical protein